ncbi:MAG: hypothetical protein NWF04_00090 [Candidatus Bathyarchaeota archaeon]|nr:hypothetical protein [Candidatus Bathyarchaeota archaeon]
MSETDKILNDIRTYLRITAAIASRTIAKSTVDTLEKAQVYERLNEDKSQQKIQEETGVPQKTISNWVTKFIEAGLVDHKNKALFTLRELGINICELTSREKKKENTKRKSLSEDEQRVTETSQGETVRETKQ